MIVNKTDVLSVFQYIVVKEGSDQLTRMRSTNSNEIDCPGYCMTLDGKPRQKEKDYIVVPISPANTKENLLDNAWSILCSSAKDAKAEADARKIELSMMLSDTRLVIETDFLCRIIEYNGNYGIVVLRCSAIPQDNGALLPGDYLEK